MIENFSDFRAVLHESGFSMGGGNAKGIFSVIPFNWEEQESFDSPVKWHTGEKETDPWEWRMRVLEECDDIAYSKVFFRTSGYITKQWYPYFYAVRRGGEDFDSAYYDGEVSAAAKRIYDVIAGNGETPLHEIKLIGGFRRESNAEFDRAMVELQMKMFITVCGRAQKKNKYGEGYGWNSTVFTTVEDFWAKRSFQLPVPDPGDSREMIKAQILRLNPEADGKKIARFICGA